MAILTESSIQNLDNLISISYIDSFMIKVDIMN